VLKFLTLAAALIVSTAAAGRDCPQPPPAAQPTPAPRPKLVVFTSTSCAPCQSLKRNTLADPRVVAATAGYEVQIVDVNDRPDLARAARVRVVPTYILYSARMAGRYTVYVEVGRGTGYRTPDEFLDWLAAPGRPGR
jgi:thioredoxin-related protein